MTSLPDKLLTVHAALEGAGLVHAFGGAIALAYHVENPRGTADIDVNVSLDPAHAEQLLALLPECVTWGTADVHRLRQDGQCRIYWDRTPLDVFLPQHELHQVLESRTVTVPFAGTAIPILSATDLTIFKALFARTKDWADIEEMLSPAGPDMVDLHEVRRWLLAIVGPDDPRLARLDEAHRTASSRQDPTSFGELAR